MEIAEVSQYFLSLQKQLVEGLGDIEPTAFRCEAWSRAGGGGGVACVLEEGTIFERGGVNFSHVFGGALPASATAKRPELKNREFQATGVSVVLHPLNPHVPTVHMNTRFLLALQAESAPIWWFGGGMDLTPYYGYLEDVQHFHRTCQAALSPFGQDYYPKFKNWCDEYFFLPHRNEPRGSGGIFFDDLHAPGFELCFNLTKNVAAHFLQAYLPIVERRRGRAYGQAQRDFQAYRRGRYVEFNLIYDRGTLFGLQSGGRTESILMSLPPLVKWRYDWAPAPGTPEAKLYSEFLVRRDWL